MCIIKKRILSYFTYFHNILWTHTKFVQVVSALYHPDRCNPHLLNHYLSSYLFLYSSSSNFNNQSENQMLCRIDDHMEPSSRDTCKEEAVGFRGLIWLTVIGQIISGIGHAPLSSILTTLMDDVAGRYRRRFVVYFCKMLYG